LLENISKLESLLATALGTDFTKMHEVLTKNFTWCGDQGKNFRIATLSIPNHNYVKS